LSKQDVTKILRSHPEQFKIYCLNKQTRGQWTDTTEYNTSFTKLSVSQWVIKSDKNANA